MSNLQRTPVTRADGVQTHIWKNVVTNEPKSSRAAKMQAPVPATPALHVHARPDEDFVLRVAGTQQFSPEDVTEAHAEARAWAVGVAKELDANPEYLPEVEPEYDDDDWETLPSVRSLKNPKTADGNCFAISHAIAKYAQDKRGETVKLVQGLESRNNPGMVFHYGALFTASNGVEMVVDYTYSQLDKKAVFPFIAEPREWLASIGTALASKSKKRSSGSWGND